METTNSRSYSLFALRNHHTSSSKKPTSAQSQERYLEPFHLRRSGRNWRGESRIEYTGTGKVHQREISRREEDPNIATVQNIPVNSILAIGDDSTVLQRGVCTADFKSAFSAIKAAFRLNTIISNSVAFKIPIPTKNSALK